MGNQVYIIGGGASGLAAAIAAARYGADVTVLERNSSVGKKILSTGNGKCNYGNTNLSPEKYHSQDSKVLKRILEHFQTDDTILFFDSVGIWPLLRNGYLYPRSEQARSVADALRQEADRLGVRICCDTLIRSVTPVKGGFCLEGIRRNDGAEETVSYQADRLILACGGLAAPGTGSDGLGFRLAEALDHTLIPAVPALTGLKIKDHDVIRTLAGLRAQAEVCLYSGTGFTEEHRRLGREYGEIQFSDAGVSGIPVMQLSGMAARAMKKRKEGQQFSLWVNFFPECGRADVREILYSRTGLRKAYNGTAYRAPALPGKEVSAPEAALAGLVPDKLIRLCSLRAGRRNSEQALSAVLDTLSGLWLPIEDTFGFEKAQVTSGGVKLTELDPDTMESRLHRNLYLTGEMTDADGVCGGYNLHYAWATGILAGTAAAGGRYEAKALTEKQKELFCGYDVGQRRR